MNIEDYELFLLDEEIAYFREARKVHPESILRDFNREELQEFLSENSQELNEIGSEIQQGLSHIPDIGAYDEAEQTFLGILYNPQLMQLYLQKKDFIDKLLEIRQSKLRAQEHKDRQKEYLSETQMQELINSKPILDVVGEYAGLPARYTKTRNIRCPLPGHDDKTGSFHIYPNTNSFYCFGCRRGGGIVQFVKHIKSIPDKEAFKELFPQ